MKDIINIGKNRNWFNISSKGELTFSIGNKYFVVNLLSRSLMERATGKGEFKKYIYFRIRFPDKIQKWLDITILNYQLNFGW